MAGAFVLWVMWLVGAVDTTVGLNAVDCCSAIDLHGSNVEPNSPREELLPIQRKGV